MSGFIRSYSAHLSYSQTNDIAATANPFDDGWAEGDPLLAVPDSTINWDVPGSVGAFTTPPTAASVDSAALAATTPALTFTWAGVTAVEAVTTPPDCSIAAGPDTIITVVNNHIDIFNKTGTEHLLSQTLNGFLGLPALPNVVFDPSVTWDQYEGRFVVVADDQTGSDSVVHVAISKDSNALDGWWFYNFDVKVGNSYLDRPEIGLDDFSLYFQGNYLDLSTGAYVNSMVWALDVNALANGQAVTPYTYTVTGLGAPTDAQYVPAHTYGFSPVNETGNTADFLVNYTQSNSGIDRNDSLNIIWVGNEAGHGSGSGTFVSLNLGDISDADPSGARQPGTSTLIDDGDSRILDAVWRGDKLYAVTEIRTGSDPTAYDVVHWFIVDTSNFEPGPVIDLSKLKLIAQGNIDLGGLQIDTYYGSLAVDNAGNMIIGFSLSGAGINPSAGYEVIPPGAPSNAVAFDFLAKGQGPYTGASVPNTGTVQDGHLLWGQHSGIALDPLDNGSFWVFNEYATNESTPNNWATMIGGYYEPALYALPVTATDLETMQQGIEGFTNEREASSIAAIIDAVPATQTVAGYASQLISNNLPLSQVAIAVDALMFGAVDNVAEFNKLTTAFLPSQLAVAAKAGFNTTTYDAEALGLALAGGNGSSNAFATNFGSLSVSAFAQATADATGVNTSAIQGFANNWIHFYSANPTATHGLSVTLASYGAAFGDAVGVALLNATAANLQELVPNALIDNAEGVLLVGVPLGLEPFPHALQS